MTMYESGNARGKQAQAKRFTAVLAASLLTGLAGPSLHGQAEAPLNVLETILESPDFGGVKKTWGIGFKIKETNQKQFSVPADFSLIKKIAAAALFTALSLGISAGAACAAVYLYNRRRAGEGKQAPPDQGAAYRAAGAEGQAYWLGLSRERFAAGREREAWAACLNAWAAWMQDSPGAGAGMVVPGVGSHQDHLPSALAAG
ncbi:MAG: hypothetical protein LBD13_06000, partial [Spirochaetaceae bacterium]|nr:hypothetical protein [Spirochaetaceae bacterium]